jgi:hypothetical protein
MELKLVFNKPPLSRPNKSVQNILKLNSPTSHEGLPPLFQKQSTTPKSRKVETFESPKASKKIQKLYEKIQSFESPRPAVKRQKYSSSISPNSDIKILSLLKTPSPRSRNSSIYSEWEVHEALQPLKGRNLREKRSTLIGSLKSY